MVWLKEIVWFCDGYAIFLKCRISNFLNPEEGFGYWVHGVSMGSIVKERMVQKKKNDLNQLRFLITMTRFTPPFYINSLKYFLTKEHLFT